MFHSYLKILRILYKKYKVCQTRTTTQCFVCICSYKNKKNLIPDSFLSIFLKFVRSITFHKKYYVVIFAKLQYTVEISKKIILKIFFFCLYIISTHG